MRRLAVFLPNWVGDAVMATPTLRALHHRFGAEAEIIGILRPRIAETLAGTPWLHTLWTRDDPDDSPRLDWRGYARRLAATGVDASVHLTNDFASALAARLGRQARHFVQERFSLPAAIGRIEAELNAVTAGHRPWENAV